MLLQLSLVEWIGYLASVLIAISMTMSSIVKLRWFSLVGASIFSFYGYLIGALPVGILNSFIAMVNIFYLRRMYSKNETFDVLEIYPNGSYVRYFLDFFKKDIDSFFPSFKQEKEAFLRGNAKALSLLTMRNGASVGLFLAKIKGAEARVLIDYVKPEYRDLKPAIYLYEINRELFAKNGVNIFKCISRNQKHSKYLMKMGFEEESMVGKEKIFVKHLNTSKK